MSLRSILGYLALFIVSLGLALVIWVTAVETEEAVTTIANVEVPVEVIGQRADTIVSDIPETVQVNVEGSVDALRTFRRDELMAIVDLSQVGVGQSSVPIRVPFEDEEITVSEPFPSEVVVNVEEIISREVPVTVSVRGSVARGYQMEPELVEPEAIEVTGPASRVEALAEARATLFLDNARETIVRTLPVFFFDQSGRVVSVNGLEMSIEEVEVTAPVTELAGFAEKPVTARWVGEPAPGYRLIDVSVEPNSVLVTGRSAQLEQLERLRTEQVNIEGLTESFTQQVDLDLPDGISLPEDEIQTVEVRVEIEPILTSNVVFKEPDVVGLREGEEAIIVPDQVRVFLYGPLSALEAFQESDLRVTLDLFGLGLGVHAVQPEVDLNSEEIEMRSWQPAQFSVVIARSVTPTPTITPTEGVVLPGMMVVVAEGVGSREWGVGTDPALFPTSPFPTPFLKP